MFSAARSRGWPSRLSRTASVTNSSISLADFRVQLAGTVADRVRRGGAAGREGQRVQERLDQADVGGQEVWIQPVHRLGQHRVPEAEHRVGELREDRGIDGGIVAVGREELI